MSKQHTTEVLAQLPS